MSNQSFASCVGYGNLSLFNTNYKNLKKEQKKFHKIKKKLIAQKVLGNSFNFTTKIMKFSTKLSFWAETLFKKMG